MYPKIPLWNHFCFNIFNRAQRAPRFLIDNIHIGASSLKQCWSDNIDHHGQHHHGHDVYKQRWRCQMAPPTPDLSPASPPTIPHSSRPASATKGKLHGNWTELCWIVTCTKILRLANIWNHPSPGSKLHGTELNLKSENINLGASPQNTDCLIDLSLTHSVIEWPMNDQS